jgi:hypothetical protein
MSKRRVINVQSDRRVDVLQQILAGVLGSRRCGGGFYMHVGHAMALQVAICTEIFAWKRSIMWNYTNAFLTQTSHVPKTLCKREAVKYGCAAIVQSEPRDEEVVGRVKYTPLLLWSFGVHI